MKEKSGMEEKSFMEEKFLKDKIDNDNVQVPDKLLPENIAALLNEGEQTSQSAKRKPDSMKKRAGGYLKNSTARALAAAAVYVILFAGVAAIGIIKASSAKGQQTGGQQAPVKTYEEIYRMLTKKDSVWSQIKNGNYWYGGFDDVILYEEAWVSADFATNGMAVDKDVAAPTQAAPSSGEMDPGFSVGSTGNGDKDDYSQTNVQEIGVDEGDYYRTDGEYIYIFKKPYRNRDSWEGARLVIVRADNGEMSTVSDTKIELSIERDGEALWINDKKEPINYEISYADMYVDGNRLLVTGTVYTYNNRNEQNAFVAVYDITDKNEPRLMDTLTQSGWYVSSRKNGDVIYLVSDYYMGYHYYYNYDWRYIDEEDYEKYIPSCNGELIDCEDIFCPDELEYRGYTIVGAIDINEPHYIDTEAVMTGSSNMYMSTDSIYFLSWISEWGNQKVIEGKRYKYSMSTLTKFAYKDGEIDYVASVEVPGSADNQFSFNEYNGNLRLVTTSTRYRKSTDEDIYWYGRGYNGYLYDTTVSGLYIFDGELNMLGCVEELAPGEQVKSSRFIGDMAYIVTFRRTDPLFAIDTSNPAKPEIMSELKISGFSEYMHPYGNGKMLGIGYEANVDTGRTECIKISMFDVNDASNVTEESRHLIKESDYAGIIYDHKALLVSLNRNLFGFAVTCSDYDARDYWNGSSVMYKLFTYDEQNGFVELLSCDINKGGYNNYGSANYPRALYIGNYLYIINTDYNIICYSLADYSYVSTWSGK